MRQYLILISLLFLVGCTGNQSINGQPNSNAPLPTTIFGRLSQLVQLGSTEETVAYKLQSDSFFVTIRGEVIFERPGALKTIIVDRESGTIRDDVSVTIDICNAVDESVSWVGSCSEYEGALYTHQLTPAPVNGVYQARDIQWDRAGHWSGTVTITAPELNEAEIVEIGTQIYPARPASTNTFELSSIALPFVVIGLFLLGIWRLGGRFVIGKLTSGSLASKKHTPEKQTSEERS